MAIEKILKYFKDIDSGDLKKETVKYNSGLPYRLRYGKYRTRKEELERRERISKTRLP